MIKELDNKKKVEFEYFVIIEFLGFFYGSVGWFLFLENLVGCFGINFFFSLVIFLGIFVIYLDNKEI